MRKIWKIVLNATVVAGLSLIGQLIYYREVPTPDQLYFSILMFCLTFLTFIRDTIADVKEIRTERKKKKNGEPVLKPINSDDGKILSLWFL